LTGRRGGPARAGGRGQHAGPGPGRGAAGRAAALAPLPAGARGCAPGGQPAPRGQPGEQPRAAAVAGLASCCFNREQRGRGWARGRARACACWAWWFGVGILQRCMHAYKAPQSARSIESCWLISRAHSAEWCQALQVIDEYRHQVCQTPSTGPCAPSRTGDADQLPPVGPGSVLGAAIAARAVPVVDLRDIFRQERQSAIVTSAHQIHCGAFPSLAPAPAPPPLAVRRRPPGHHRPLRQGVVDCFLFLYSLRLGVV